MELEPTVVVPIFPFLSGPFILIPLIIPLIPFIIISPERAHTRARARRRAGAAEVPDHNVASRQEEVLKPSLSFNLRFSCGDVIEKSIALLPCGINPHFQIILLVPAVFEVAVILLWWWGRPIRDNVSSDGDRVVYQ